MRFLGLKSSLSSSKGQLRKKTLIGHKRKSVPIEKTTQTLQICLKEVFYLRRLEKGRVKFIYHSADWST